MHVTKDPTVRHQATPAVYILLERNKKIFLIRRANTYYYEGFFGLPSGHIESGESLRQAAVREAEEETGVKIMPADLKLVHIAIRPAEEEPSQTRLDFYYSARKWQGDPTNNEPNKCSEIRWVSRQDLPEDMVPVVKQIITAIYEGQTESEIGF